ncbi:MAG: hypothetical protein ABJB76_11310 [Candidatus Nitrosocosmicus sp.]
MNEIKIYIQINLSQFDCRESLLFSIVFIIIMGDIFKPKDISNKHRKKISNESIKDINPETDDSSKEKD